MGDVQADCPHLVSGFGCAATTLLWSSRAEHANVCTGGSLRPGGAMRGRLMGPGPWGSAARHSSESHAPTWASKLSRLQITTGSRVWLNHLHFYTLRCKHARAKGSDSRFPEGPWCKVPAPARSRALEEPGGSGDIGLCLSVHPPQLQLLRSFS